MQKIYKIIALASLSCLPFCSCEIQTNSPEVERTTISTTNYKIPSYVPQLPSTTTTMTQEVQTYPITDPVTEQPIVEEIPTISAEDLHWAKCYEEYPVATELWLLMKGYGWTDAACAGLMGNFMKEVGGGEEKINGLWIDTLKLKPNLYGRDNRYYGICQWCITWYPEIFPENLGYQPTLREQLEYLRETLATRHYYGFDESYFKTATNYREVAKVFFDNYEKANETSDRRQRNAEKAYNYFVFND